MVHPGAITGKERWSVVVVEKSVIKLLFDCRYRSSCKRQLARLWFLAFLLPFTNLGRRRAGLFLASPCPLRVTAAENLPEIESVRSYIYRRLALGGRHLCRSRCCSSLMSSRIRVAQPGPYVRTPPTSSSSQINGNMSQKPARLIAVTAVWGKWHIDQFLHVNLPTLLAPHNFPKMAKSCEITYIIYTSKEDLASLSNAPGLHRLSRHLKLDFRILGAERLCDPIAAHHHAWGLATGIAKSVDSYLLLMPPDVAWSDGSFAHVAELLSAGKKAIFMTYLRAESDSFTRQLARKKDQLNGITTVSGADLVDMAMRCLHPLMAAYLRESPYFPIHPEMMLWTIPQEGIAARVLAREMFIFKPNAFNLNAASLAAEEINPSDIHFITDSDDLFAVSLSECGKDSAWHRRARLADPFEIANWWLDYDSPINDLIVGSKIRWHRLPVSEHKWRAREQAADLFLRRCAARREGLRTWRVARSLGCSIAARAIALGIHTKVFDHALRENASCVIFLPTDTALSSTTHAELEQLLSPAGHRDMVHMVRHHYVPAKSSAKMSLQILQDRAYVEWQSAAGQNLWLAKQKNGYCLNGIPVVGEPLIAGRHVFVQLDGLLFRPGKHRQVLGHPPTESVVVERH